MPVYRHYCYSIPELLELLVGEGGESIRLEVGYAPSLTIKGEVYEIEGPVVKEEAADELLRAVADTREMRVFRQGGTVGILQTFRGAKILVRAVQACGVFRLELHALSTRARP
jgi:Tfp pilus assembly pilus retraction ATPase PilT